MPFLHSKLSPVIPPPTWFTYFHAWTFTWFIFFHMLFFFFYMIHLFMWIFLHVYLKVGLFKSRMLFKPYSLFSLILSLKSTLTVLYIFPCYTDSILFILNVTIWVKILMRSRCKCVGYNTRMMKHFCVAQTCNRLRNSISSTVIWFNPIGLFNKNALHYHENRSCLSVHLVPWGHRCNAITDAPRSTSLWSLPMNWVDWSTYKLGLSSKDSRRYIDSFYEAHQTAIMGIRGVCPEGKLQCWRMGEERRGENGGRGGRKDERRCLRLGHPLQCVRKQGF